MARKREFFMGGPCAVFTSLFASCARSTLSKIENEASSETASARAIVSPKRKRDTNSKSLHALAGKRCWRLSILGFISDKGDAESTMVANFRDHRNKVSA